MITHAERMRACLKRERTDRTPVALWRHFPVDDQDPETLAVEHLAFQAAHDFDLVKVTPASSFSVKDWGVEDVWEGNSEGTRRYSKHVIKEPGDWERLADLDGAKHLSAQIACLEQIRAGLGPDTPMLQTVFSPLAQAKHLAGDATLLLHLRRYPEAVEKGLQIIARSTARFVEAAAEAGTDGIFYAVQHAQAGVLSQEEFSRFGRPWDLAVLQAAGELWCNMLHLHGKDVYFDSVVDYPVEIMNWHDRETPPTLAAANQSWRGVVCGGLAINTLVFGSRSEVAAEAAEAISATSGRGLILSTGCVIPIITPLGNVRAARASVENDPAGRVHS